MQTPEEFREICQQSLPFVPWMDSGLKRLPGMKTLAMADWLVTDEVFARQMAYRDWLIAQRRADIVAETPEAGPAAQELLETLLETLAEVPDYRVGSGEVLRPDGVTVPLRRDDPMATVGRLVQEDFCLLMPQGGEHVLKAAVLCFPASWTLAEKIGRPMMRIHKPVPDYDGDIGLRVQRMFDRMQAGVVMFRANALLYSDPDLHHPRSEAAPRVPDGDGPDRWMRVERQTLRKLPVSGAIAFGIHTYLVPEASLSAAQRDSFGKRV
jgi:hypothetical protein